MVRIQHEINIENLVRFLCARNCDTTWRDFFHASDADIAAEVAWAAQRPQSGARRLEPGAAPTPRSALTPTEEERLSIYQASWPGCCYDLGQNPLWRKMCSDATYLHTLVKGAGLAFSVAHDRFLLAKELMEAMGFPCSPAAVIASGVASPFAEGAPCPPTRTRASMVSQAGNAMHVVVIGAFELAVLLKFASLGSRVAVNAANANDGGSCAFARRYKRQKLEKRAT